MAGEQIPLTQIYDGWGTYQEKIAGALAPLTPEQLALRVAPQLRSIGEIATHIIAVRVRWFTNVLHVEEPDLLPLAAWDRPAPDAPARTTSELAESLGASWGMIERALAEWTPTDLGESLEGAWHGKSYTFTRQWVIWHVAEHDLHHGGELSLTLGAHGLQAPDI
jgi:uncharacterized damage-inducible protein DinB